MTEKVVITGLGAVTPLGLSVDDFWRGLVDGRSGTGPITRFDPSRLPSRMAGELKGFDPLTYMDRKEARRSDPFTQYALAAALEAMSQNHSLTHKLRRWASRAATTVRGRIAMVEEEPPDDGKG